MPKLTEADERAFADLRQEHQARGTAIRWRVRAKRSLIVLIALPAFAVECTLAIWRVCRDFPQEIVGAWQSTPRNLLNADARRLHAQIAGRRALSDAQTQERDDA